MDQSGYKRPRSPSRTVEQVKVATATAGLALLQHPVDPSRPEMAVLHQRKRCKQHLGIPLGTNSPTQLSSTVGTQQMPCRSQSPEVDAAAVVHITPSKSAGCTDRQVEKLALSNASNTIGRTPPAACPQPAATGALAAVQDSTTAEPPHKSAVQGPNSTSTSPLTTAPYRAYQPQQQHHGACSAAAHDTEATPTAAAVPASVPAPPAPAPVPAPAAVAAGLSVAATGAPRSCSIAGAGASKACLGRAGPGASAATAAGLAACGSLLAGPAGAAATFTGAASECDPFDYEPPAFGAMERQASRSKAVGQAEAGAPSGAPAAAHNTKLLDLVREAVVRHNQQPATATAAVTEPRRQRQRQPQQQQDPAMQPAPSGEALQMLAALASMPSLARESHLQPSKARACRHPAAAGAAGASAAGAAFTPVIAVSASTCTIAQVSQWNSPLETALMRWAKACGGAGPARRSTPVVDLLPRYNTLLAMYDAQYSSSSLAAGTVAYETGVLHRFLTANRLAFECSEDYAAMLGRLNEAHIRYSQLKAIHCNTTRAKHAAAAAPPQQPRRHKTATRTGPAGDTQQRGAATAAATTAAAAPVAEASVAEATGAAAAAAAQTEPTAAALLQVGQAHSTATAAAAAAAAATAATAATAAVTAAFLPVPGQGVTFLQLAKQLAGSGCDWGLAVLLSLAKHSHGLTEDSEVGPFLQMYTTSEKLQQLRAYANGGSTAAQELLSNVLNGLLQLLQRPELEAVLGVATRCERLVAVSKLYWSVEASLEAHDRAQQQAAAAAAAAVGTGREGVRQEGGLRRLPSNVARQAAGGQQQLPPARLLQRQGRMEDTGAGLAAAGVSAAVEGTALGAPGRSAAASGGAAAGLMLQRPPVSLPAGQAATARAPRPIIAGRDPAAADGALTPQRASCASGRNMSMAVLLQQLQASPDAAAVSGGGGCWVSLQHCVQRIKESASCFVGVNDIPASLLVTNYIAEVGEKAQQCLNAACAVVEQDGGHTGAAECSAVLHEVEGLLLLAQQPVLLQLLGRQKVQELVGGLLGCKQRLRDTCATRIML